MNGKKERDPKLDYRPTTGSEAAQESEIEAAKGKPASYTLRRGEYILAIQYGGGHRWLEGMPTPDFEKLKGIAESRQMRLMDNRKRNGGRGAKPAVSILRIMEVYDA